MLYITRLPMLYITIAAGACRLLQLPGWYRYIFAADQCRPRWQVSRGGEGQESWEHHQLSTGAHHPPCQLLLGLILPMRGCDRSSRVARLGWCGGLVWPMHPTGTWML